MSDTDRHVHVCACGAQWDCSKADCHIADECTECEEQAIDVWIEAEFHLHGKAMSHDD